MIQILLTHGVSFMYKGTSLLVLDEYTLNGTYGCEWIDASNWTRKDVLNFLGY